ncbi:MAG TPA: hypothetical protein VNQ76_05385 [Planctomicrobium sp.]|nr:hypothetical protein [Planctomicrobium sp.]
MKVIFYHDRPGEELTLRLSHSSGTISNGDQPAPLVEADPGSHPLRYTATITEPLTGWFTAQVIDSQGILYTGRVKVANDSGAYLIDDPADTVANLGDIVIEDVTVSQLSSSAVAQLARTRQINITIPTLVGRNLSDPLIRGDSYTTALEAAIEFSRSDFPDIPDGSTATLTARTLESGSVESFSISGDQSSIPVRTGTKVVRFEPLSSQTRLWEPGQYEFDVEISFPGGERRTFIGPGVFLRVLDDVTK